MTRYRAPRLLEGGHQLEGFTSSSTEQTSWLRNHAQPSSASNSTRVFVVTPTRGPEGAGRDPQPVALLARLGVHVDHEGRGLGAALLADAVARVVGISEAIGCRGLLIHAETNEARDFYLHLLPELLPSPTDDLHLVLLMKDVRRTLWADARAPRIAAARRHRRGGAGTFSPGERPVGGTR